MHISPSTLFLFFKGSQGALLATPVLLLSRRLPAEEHGAAQTIGLVV